MRVSTTAFLAGCLLLAAGVMRADESPPSESLAEHRLREISEHQMAVLSEAAAEGGTLDTAALKQRAEELIHEYESLLRDNPDFAAGYASYGYLLWKIGARKEAVAILLKANQLDANIPLVKNELGNYLAEEGKPLEAVNYFMAAIKLAPNEPLYHYQLGSLLYEARDDFLRSGEWNQDALDHAMLEAFATAARLAPDRIEFTFRYAEAFGDVGNPDWNAALKQWQTLEAKAQSDDERATMQLEEAHVLFSMGKPDAARKVLDAIKDPKLEAQKQKLIAQFAPGAGR